MLKKGLSLVLLASSASAHAVDFSAAEICKAAIAVEMGRDTKRMKTHSASDGPSISYQRDDGDRFKYRCRIEGDTVVWRTFLNDTREWGRWRNSYSAGDAKTTFILKGDRLVISNDQAGSKNFTKKDF